MRRVVKPSRRRQRAQILFEQLQREGYEDGYANLLHKLVEMSRRAGGIKFLAASS